MTEDIFDLFDLNDLPDDITNQIYLTNVERIMVLLRYAKRPLTAKEIAVGMYRKFNITLINTYLFSLMKKMETTFPNVTRVKDEQGLKLMFIDNSKTAAKTKSNNDFDLNEILQVLEQTAEPIGVNKIEIGLYRMFGKVLNKKSLSNKLYEYSMKQDSCIVNDNGNYMLKEVAVKKTNKEVFYSANLYKVDNEALRKQLDSYLTNGHQALLELLERFYKGLTIDSIIQLLKTEYGMEKTKNYVTKEISSLVCKQNKKITKVNNIYKLEK